MSGVTNRLIEAARRRKGNAGEAGAIIDALRQQHAAALTSLIQREEEQARIRHGWNMYLRKAAALRRNGAAAGTHTAHLDAISSLEKALRAAGGGGN